MTRHTRHNIIGASIFSLAWILLFSDHLGLGSVVRIGTAPIWVIGICAAFIAYFLPAVIAGERGMVSATGVFVANLFLGWTFLGWVFCLVWAFSGKSKTQQDLEENEQAARLVEAYRAAQSSTAS